MKNIIFLKGLFLVIAILLANASFAQLDDGFDIKKAYQQAKDKGVLENNIEEYVNHQHSLYLRKKTPNKPNDHNHIEKPYDMGTIYLGGNNAGFNPNTPQNIYCPNAGFEGYNFTNWSGYTGTVTDGNVGALFPIYTQTATGILNPTGINPPVSSPNDFHAIFTTPATNNNYPNCVGYDSLACRVIGTQTVSEIPLVNPLGTPSSARIGRYSGFSNDVGSKLTYNLALNPNNKNFTIAYALVLNNANHNPWEQPYFSVNVRDQNGTLVPGCSAYAVTINSLVTTPGSSSYDPLFKQSAVILNTYYRPWSTYAFDFSNYPTITSVTVEFYVGGCSLGGHFGYAYVDAQCGQGGAVASFCAGSNTSVLTAPAGYNTYQWTGPSGPVSAANGGNTGTATITPVTAGQVFTCNVTSQNGCSSVFTTTVSITTVSITGMNSTPSCPNGNSGTAVVAATGSSSGYSYLWQNSLGATVGNTQTATGLSPGIYSVTASSPLCGSATSTVLVAISAPTFYSLSAPYCGTTAWITNNGGSNYKWYTASPLALIPGATSSSLTINSPVNGTGYFLVYTTASGCKDSIKYVLTQQPGGSIYASNIKSICAGNNNSYAVINLNTSAPPVYSYTVTGPGGYNSVLNNTNSIKDSVINLSIGTYSATVFDGQCLYNTTFSVSPFVYSYTLTPASSTLCSSGSASLAVNFGNTTPTACGLATSGCASTAISQIGTGTIQNTNTTWPCVLGNYYKNNRHQLLYTAAELNAAGITPGKLSSIAFQVISMMPGQVPTSSSSSYYSTIPFNYTIKIKCTSATALTSTFDNTGLVQVFNGNYSATVGWNTFNFNQSYEWAPGSNILIDICYNLQTYYTSNPIMNSTSTGGIMCTYAYSDSSPMCGTTNIATTSTNRPNIRFGNCAGNPGPSAYTYTWTPNISLSSSTTHTTIANPTVTTVYTVQVNPIGQTNCIQAQTTTVIVTNANPATITATGPVCTNSSTLSLTATPTGGVWSGLGITSAGVLTPSAAVVGNNTYTYTIGTSTCSSVGNTTVSVEQFIPSTITGAINPQCLPATAINLSTALTTSTLGTGTWSGNGVTGNLFDPNVAGIGTHTLTYTTNSSPTASLCPSSNTINVAVSTAAQPTITAVQTMCSNASTLSLSANPTGGTWVGSGVSSSGVLTPSIATVGNNTYTYSVGSAACSASGTTAISIEKFVPSTITGAISALCITNPAINLSTALSTSTLGVGVWSGNGVTGTTFNPNTAGVGVHTLTYSTNSNPTTTLCPSASTIAVTVNSVTQPTISTLGSGPYCNNYTAQQLNANPAGGVWSPALAGTNVSTTGQFSPISSLLGSNKVYYTMTNAPCVKKDSILIDVVRFVPATITSVLGPYCIYDPAVDLKSIAQFTTGVWSGAGVTTTIFNPAGAGAGTHVLTYSTTSIPTTTLCSDTKTTSIVVNPKPIAVAIPNNPGGCNYPWTVGFSSTNNPSGTAVWNFGDGSATESGLFVSHVYNTPGTYTATVIYTDNIGCKDTANASSVITIFAVPDAAFEPSLDITTVVDAEISFDNQTSDLNLNTYTWDFGGLDFSTEVSPNYLFINSGEYFVTLIATSPDGCQDTAVKKITINPDVVLYVPNAFTPGTDGLNDVFQIFLPPTGVDYSTFDLVIYDRWGELIYKTNDVSLSWNGRKNNSGEILKQDIYVYKIMFKDEKKKYYEKLGHVSLLRK